MTTRRNMLLSNTMLFELILFWILLQFLSSLHVPMLTGSSIVNMTSDTATVTFNVVQKPTPTPVKEFVGGVLAAASAGAGVATPSAKHRTEAAAASAQLAVSVEGPAPVLVDIAMEQIKPEISAGENPTVKISLVNFEPGVVPVTVVYTVFDAAGNVVYVQEEQLMVETQTEFIETIDLPPDLQAGVYTISTTITSDSQTAHAETSITIAPQEKTTMDSLLERIAPLLDFATSIITNLVESVKQFFASF